jgi:DNA adenine methylase
MYERMAAAQVTLTQPFALTLASPLRWVGSKRWILPHILPHLTPSPGGTLIDAFTGSGIVGASALHNARQTGSDLRVVMTDLNADVIDFHTTLKTRPEEFAAEVSALFTSPSANSLESYMSNRKRFNSLPSCPERTLLWFYLNRHGFNGIMRYNSSGGFNVPYGKVKNPLATVELLTVWGESLANADLVLGDFAASANLAKRGDVVYLDPPYVPRSATASFTSYTSDGFSHKDQVRLDVLAETLKARGVKVVVSNSAEAVDLAELYKAATAIHRIQVRRSLAAKGDSRKGAPEIIAVFEPEI